ncbi:hypothetical protein PR202_gb07126 [Eleusine coracana subsp. coracana]|uniref:Uncharacterized protein n=1 Tax=Eleusine coracana subsp. coracana TaxID=191504 RepID=A0AAV5EC84_ELECO|nr:hypothetical protein PR202_gb07126 [Eleusine coracana subsp. coracana]
MDVYISEEYVAKRRAERRAARAAAAAAAARGGGCREEKAAARADGGALTKRWSGAWAEMSRRPDDDGDGINVEDVVFSYFSA